MSTQAIEAARAAFVEQFASAPAGVVFAPGRVNLIGDHVDYNDGMVLPMPVSQGTAIAYGRSGDSEVEAYAANYAASDSFSAHDPARPDEFDWRSYVRGMFAHWPKQVPGLRLAISGNLPRGVGLSSSASLCIAIGDAIGASTGSALEPERLARVAQHTEQTFAELECGIMDQMAVSAGVSGSAMLLDCRSLRFQHIVLPDAWHIAIIESGVTRELAGGEYNQRRAQCEAACKALGVSSLRDAALADFERYIEDLVVAKRARHVVSEIARVERAAAAMEIADLAAFGRLLNESHASLRDDFEVTVPAVDDLVCDLQDAIGESGGARMTGAGFGGAVVAVCDERAMPAVLEAAGGRTVHKP